MNKQLSTSDASHSSSAASNHREVEQREMLRRKMLGYVGCGMGMVGAANLLGMPQAIAAAPQNLLATPHFAPRAKRVIHLFMNGGPYQGDLFDPKPALKKFAGSKPTGADLVTERPTAGLMPSPFKFRPRGESGLQVSDLMPHLSQYIDDICVLNSMHIDNPNHGPALLQMNNGTIIPTRPSMGAWFLYGLGTENQNLPGYVVLCPGRPVRFSILWNSAFLPSKYQGTYINHSIVDPEKMLPHLSNTQWDHLTQSGQLDLLQQLNADHAAAQGGDSLLTARSEAMETAYRMHVHDLHATILHLLRLDHERLTYRHAGRDFRLTDVHGRVVHEIIS